MAKVFELSTLRLRVYWRLSVKRLLVFLVIGLLLIGSLSARSVGYALGYYGQSVEADSELTSSGAEFSLVYKPFNLAFANPSVIGRTALGTLEDGAYRVPYLQIGLGLDLFRTTRHPFNFLAHNIIAYSPMIGVSYAFDPRRDTALLALEVSPFKLIQKDFWYEVLSPFFLYDIVKGEMDSWGFNIIRFTYFLK
jgi:hypothetical protein